jgi:hypothetical protein
MLESDHEERRLPTKPSRPAGGGKRSGDQGALRTDRRHSRHQAHRRSWRPFCAAIKKRSRPAFDINALITDIANANSTLGFYRFPAGSKKNAEHQQTFCR